jgi:hypothetical protein
MTQRACQAHMHMFTPSLSAFVDCSTPYYAGPAIDLATCRTFLHIWRIVTRPERHRHPLPADPTNQSDYTPLHHVLIATGGNVAHTINMQAYLEASPEFCMWVLGFPTWLIRRTAWRTHQRLYRCAAICMLHYVLPAHLKGISPSHIFILHRALLLFVVGHQPEGPCDFRHIAVPEAQWLYDVFFLPPISIEHASAWCFHLLSSLPPDARSWSPLLPAQNYALQFLDDLLPDALTVFQFHAQGERLFSRFISLSLHLSILPDHCSQCGGIRPDNHGTEYTYVFCSCCGASVCFNPEPWRHTCGQRILTTGVTTLPGDLSPIACEFCFDLLIDRVNHLLHYAAFPGQAAVPLHPGRCLSIPTPHARRPPWHRRDTSSPHIAKWDQGRHYPTHPGPRLPTFLEHCPLLYLQQHIHLSWPHLPLPALQLLHHMWEQHTSGLLLLWLQCQRSLEHTLHLLQQLLQGRPQQHHIHLAA